jgi:hypothetical protein
MECLLPFSPNLFVRLLLINVNIKTHNCIFSSCFVYASSLVSHPKGEKYFAGI